jgi:hypothetical protein
LDVSKQVAWLEVASASFQPQFVYCRLLQLTSMNLETCLGSSQPHPANSKGLLAHFKAVIDSSH